MADTIHPISLAEAITECRVLLNETTAGFFTDAQITNWIKEACVDISSTANCAESEITVPMVTSQQAYAEADVAAIKTIVKVEAVVHVEGGEGLTKVHPRMTGKLPETTAGEAKYWFFYNQKLNILPIPNSDLNAENLTVYCSIVTDDITALHDGFQPLTIPYAVSKALFKDRKFQASTLSMSIYTGWLQAKLLNKIKEPDTADMYMILSERPKNV